MIVIYENHKDTDPKVPEDFTWADLVEMLSDFRVAACTASDCVGKACLEKYSMAWSPVTIAGSRANENVSELHALVLDLDALAPDVAAAALQRLQSTGLRAHVHTTHNSRPDRLFLRAVVALSRPVAVTDGGGEWLRFYPTAVKLLGLPADMSCSDPARIYFRPSVPQGVEPAWLTFEGGPLDVDAVLAQAPDVAPPVTAAPPPAGGFGPAPPGLLDHARARLAKHGPGVSKAEGGPGRNRHTFVVGAILFHDLALTWEEGWPLAVDWNATCRPPLNEARLAETLRNGLKYAHGQLGKERSDWSFVQALKARLGQRFECSDTGNAERLVAHFGQDIRWCQLWKTWLIWDGRRWLRDQTLTVDHWAKETVRRIPREASNVPKEEYAAILDHALKSEQKWMLEAMVARAKVEPGIGLTPDDLDQDQFALNVLNGTLDLRTGQLRPHRRSDRITRLAPVVYDPTARSELWERFLREAIESDALRAFLQRAVGYTLTGSVDEEVLFFVHGGTNSGKSTFLEALKATLGDYAKTADFETFAKKKGDSGPREDVARLCGSRAVISIELEQGKEMAEALVKMVTGKDTIAARHLYAGTFEFLPTFKLWIAANHAPRIRDDDMAVWRRIHRLKFDRTVPEEKRDPALKAALIDPATSGAAILAWAVQGCLAWQKGRLGAPPEVKNATEDLRKEMSPISEFLKERCVIGPDERVARRALREAYERWCRENSITFPISPRKFADKVRSVTDCRDTTVRDIAQRVVDGWAGVGLRATGAL